MLWLIEYVVYSIIIVFLLDKIYDFLKNNNGVYESRIVNDSQKNMELQNSNNSGKIHDTHISQQKQYQNQKNNYPQYTEQSQQSQQSQQSHQIDMENELNKLFQSDGSDIQGELTHSTTLIESSNILDLPVNTY